MGLRLVPKDVSGGPGSQFQGYSSGNFPLGSVPRFSVIVAGWFSSLERRSITQALEAGSELRCSHPALLGIQLSTALLAVALFANRY